MTPMKKRRARVSSKRKNLILILKKRVSLRKKKNRVSKYTITKIGKKKRKEIEKD